MSALLGVSSLVRLDGWLVVLRMRREECLCGAGMCICNRVSVLEMEADLGGTGEFNRSLYSSMDATASCSRCV